MAIDPSRLQITQLIVHEVPRQATESSPVLSDVVSSITPEIRNFFKEKIGKSLSSASLDIVFDEDQTSPVPGLVRAIVASDPGMTFVARSQEMARHLFSSQPPVSNPGLLTVVEGTIEGRVAVALLKLEKEEGVQVRREGAAGSMTLNVHHIRSLMLTGSTKVFKVGLFLGRSRGNIEGVASDNQRGYYASTGVAEFFLKRFLGCRLRELPAVSTKAFHDASEQFFNRFVDDPVLKTQYQMALITELTSNRATIHPQHFASNHLKAVHRTPYRDFLGEQAVNPHEITKDTSHIDAQLRKVQMDFESGIALIAPAGAVAGHMTLQSMDDGQTSVEIRDHLQRVRGRG